MANRRRELWKKHDAFDFDDLTTDINEEEVDETYFDELLNKSADEIIAGSEDESESKKD